MEDEETPTTIPTNCQRDLGEPKGIKINVYPISFQLFQGYSFVDLCVLGWWVNWYLDGQHNISQKKYILWNYLIDPLTQNKFNKKSWSMSSFFFFLAIYMAYLSQKPIISLKDICFGDYNVTKDFFACVMCIRILSYP